MFPFTLLFRKGNIKRLCSSQNGRGVGRETQRQMRLRERFPVAGLLLVNSVLRFARQFVALSMLSRSHDQSCAENARFRKTVHRVEFFSCKRWLVRDLSEFTQQDGKMLVCDKPGRVITYVFCCDLHFKGKWSLAKSYFKRKLLLRLSQKVCGLLTSPVLLRKFSLKIRGRRRQVKRRFKSEFAVFQSSSRLFRRCLFNVHDVTRDDSQRRFLAQHRVQMLEQRCSLSKRRRNNVLT